MLGPKGISDLVTLQSNSRYRHRNQGLQRMRSQLSVKTQPIMGGSIKSVCTHIYVYTHIHILYICVYACFGGFPGGSVKNPACSPGDLGSIPGLRKMPCRREWLPTPVFLPGGFHGQRSLAGYSTWGLNKSDTTEPLTLALSFTFIYVFIQYLHNLNYKWTA